MIARHDDIFPFSFYILHSDAAGALAGALIIGGMVVTNTRYAAAKTNDTQQVGGDLSSTNDVGQLEGGTNVVNQVGGDDSGTNAPPNLLGQPLLGLRLGNPPPAITFVTDEDISNQWRVVSVSSNTLNASVFTYPVASVSFEQSPAIWAEALANGAGYGSWRIPFGGWRFTFGEVVWTNAFLWCEGYFRSAFANRSNEIQLLNERLTLCPQVNWSLYNLVASRAWAATNDVGGLVATFEVAALYPNVSETIAAVVTNCHADAYIGCTWSGGEGISFSNPLVNDGIGGDRPERVYELTVSLIAVPGTYGRLELACSGNTQTQLWLDRWRTSPVTPDSENDIGIPESGWFACTKTYYMTSAALGRGTIAVTLDLVYGSDAILKASVKTGGAVVNGFTASNISWRVVSGPAEIVETNVVGNADSYVEVVPTSYEGDVVVEAKFNDDAIRLGAGKGTRLL